jgi:hypothetical protein
MSIKNTILRVAVPTILLLGFIQIAEAQNHAVLAKAERITGDQFPFSARTTRGASVFAVSRPSTEVLAAIDRGLTNLFAIARKNGYRRHLDYSDYTVYIARPDITDDGSGNYTPGISVGAAQYRGSVYDQGGYIYAAGMVIDFASSAFVIAEHTKNFEGISNVVRYEGEHIVLYYNDRQRFEATKDHSRGGGHPILQ